MMQEFDSDVEVRIATAISKLTFGERIAMATRAKAGHLGGDALEGSVLKRATELKLVFNATGRLRPFAWRFLTTT